MGCLNPPKGSFGIPCKLRKTPAIMLPCLNPPKGSFGIPWMHGFWKNRVTIMQVSIPRRGHSEFRVKDETWRVSGFYCLNPPKGSFGIPWATGHWHLQRTHLVSIPRRGHSEFRVCPSLGPMGQGFAGCVSERSVREFNLCKFFCNPILAGLKRVVKQKIFS